MLRQTRFISILAVNPYIRRKCDPAERLIDKRYARLDDAVGAVVEAERSWSKYCTHDEVIRLGGYTDCLRSYPEWFPVIKVPPQVSGANFELTQVQWSQEQVATSLNDRAGERWSARSNDDRPHT